MNRFAVPLRPYPKPYAAGRPGRVRCVLDSRHDQTAGRRMDHTRFASLHPPDSAAVGKLGLPVVDDGAARVRDRYDGGEMVRASLEAFLSDCEEVSFIFGCQ